MTKEEKKKVIDARKRKAPTNNNRSSDNSTFNAVAANDEDPSSVVGKGLLSVLAGVSNENNDANSIATQNNQPIRELNVDHEDTSMGFGGRNENICRKNNSKSLQIISPIRIEHSVKLVTCMSRVYATSTCEMDSHVDTCVSEYNFSPIYFTGRKCSVSAYNDEYDPLDDIPIAAGATAYDDPYDGTTYILIVHEGKTNLSDVLTKQLTKLVRDSLIYQFIF